MDFDADCMQCLDGIEHVTHDGASERERSGNKVKITRPILPKGGLWDVRKRRYISFPEDEEVRRRSKV